MDLFPESLQPEALGFSVVTLMASCFFALYPDETAREQIAEQQREQCKRIGLSVRKWRPPELFHLSVAQWGKTRRILEPLDRALRNAKARFRYPAFDVTLASTARLSAQDDEFAFVLEADATTVREALGLRGALADAQVQAGLIATRGIFCPHVTVAYGRHVPDEAVQIPPIRFRAKRIAMVVSQPGARTHHHLDHWNLDEPDAL